jgi:hypothetical protein
LGELLEEHVYSERLVEDKGNSASIALKVL